MDKLSKKVRGIIRKWEKIRSLRVRKVEIDKKIEKLENMARLAEFRLEETQLEELKQNLPEAI